MEEKCFNPNNPYDTAIREITILFEGRSFDFVESVLNEVKNRLRKDFILKQKPSS